MRIYKGFDLAGLLKGQGYLAEAYSYIGVTRHTYSDAESALLASSFYPEVAKGKVNGMLMATTGHVCAFVPCVIEEGDEVPEGNHPVIAFHHQALLAARAMSNTLLELGNLATEQRMIGLPGGADKDVMEVQITQDHLVVKQGALSASVWRWGKGHSHKSLPINNPFDSVRAVVRRIVQDKVQGFSNEQRAILSFDPTLFLKASRAIGSPQRSAHLVTTSWSTPLSGVIMRSHHAGITMPDLDMSVVVPPFAIVMPAKIGSQEDGIEETQVMKHNPRALDPWL